MSRLRLLLLFGIALCAGCAIAGRRVSIIYSSIASQLAADEVLLELKRSFIEDYKNRVTITAMFTVDAAMGSPSPSIFDGDLHFAGRAPEIGLRLVGEIKNAASVDTAVALIHSAERTKRPIRMTGAWRIWPEHALGAKHEQGRPVEPLTNANPDHAFEIHPVTRLGSLSLLQTFRPVDGYRPGSAEPTFGVYAKATCSLKVEAENVTLTLTTGLYNDVHFLMRIGGEGQVVVGDGRFVSAAALDLDGNLLVERLRMVFTRGTPPERLVRTLRPGARRHVWGLPRLDLAEISRRIRGSASNPALLKGPLPYEILVLGVYPVEQ